MKELGGVDGRVALAAELVQRGTRGSGGLGPFLDGEERAEHGAADQAGDSAPPVRAVEIGPDWTGLRSTRRGRHTDTDPLIPTPDPMAANCHGPAMAIGSSTYRGPAHYGWENGMSTLDAHYAFMDMQGCHA